jgi:glycosyltransferase involved in cell wall biosynthesis
MGPFSLDAMIRVVAVTAQDSPTPLSADGPTAELPAGWPARAPVRRALVLSWEFPPRIVGGIATHVYHLSKALVKRGFAVDVVTCGFPGAPREEVVEGVRVTRVDNDRVPEADFLLWIYRLNSQLIAAADRLLAQGHFDVIHAHDWLVGRAAMELKQRYGLPLVTTIHATEMGRGSSAWSGYRRTVHEIEGLLVGHSDRVICCSKYMAEFLQKTLEVPPERLDIIPNGVDVSKFEGVRAAAAPDDDGPDPRGFSILYVGRLVHEKGLNTLIAAFEKVAAKEPRARLTIVGDGPIRRTLAEEVVRRRIHAKVRFEGFVAQNRLLHLLGTCDVFVAPSLYEPFGIVALEAMASRIPVIVSDVGGLREIVEDRVSGLKVPPGDIGALTGAILQTLEDPRQAASRAQNGYEIVSAMYSWDGIAVDTARTFERALKAAARSPLAVRDDQFLRDPDLLHLLLTAGATEGAGAKSATEIAEVILAPKAAVKTMLGRQASQGYVCVVGASGREQVTYHLSPTGILKACSEFS